MDDRLIISIDINNMKKAESVIKETSDLIRFFKVGPIPFISCGIKLIEMIKGYGNGVFIDLKFNDIPNTVKEAVRELMKLDVDMFTIHSSCGPSAIAAVRETIQKERKKILMIAVTILTSFDNYELKRIGFKDSIDKSVYNLAKLAIEAGADGVVCSAEEVQKLREIYREIKLVVPGIRLTNTTAYNKKASQYNFKDDQKRKGSAADVIRKGADYIVVGRPIIMASSPRAVVETLLSEIKIDV